MIDKDKYLTSSLFVFALFAWGQGEVLPRESQSAIQLNTVRENQPRSINPMDLLTLRDIGGVGGDGLSVSADGNYAAFELHQADSEANTYRVAWFVVPTTPGGSPVNVGDGGDPTLFSGVGEDAITVSGAWWSKAAKWSPDSWWIAYLRKEKGEIQVWRSRRDGHVQEQLTRNAADVLDFAWALDGSKIFFIVNALRSAKRAALRDEAERGFLLDERITPLLSSKPIWPCDVFKPEATLWGYEGFKPCPSEVWVYEIGTGIERKATDEEKAQYEGVRRTPDLARHPDARSVTFSPDRKRVAWIEAAEPGKKGDLARLRVFAAHSPDGKSPIVCEDPQCTGRINSLWWGDDGREIYFLRSEGANYASNGFYAWPVGAREVRTVLRRDDLLEGCVVVRTNALCLHESATTPNKVVSVDLGGGSIVSLFDPNPELRNVLLSPATKLVWKNEFGQETFGFLVKPLRYERGKRYPLIITTYRCRGFLRGGVGDEYPIQVFAANGFAVLCFETPTDWELLATAATWDEASRREREDAYDKRITQSSLDAAIDLLDTMGVIDPVRIGLTGLSYGAETTQYALFHSKRIAAAAVSGPGWDPISYYLHSIGGRRLMETLGFGNPEGSAASYWRNVSLALNVDRVKAPLLIQAPDSEYLVAMQTFVALREGGKPVEMYVFPNEYHIKWQPKHRFFIYQRNLDWFNFWLKGQEDPDPTKAEQYARWRKLRELRDAEQNAKPAKGPP